MNSKDTDIKKAVLRHITQLTNSGAGVRTTEVGSIAKDLEIDNSINGYQNVSNAIGELLNEKKIRCVTETWKDYCWLIPYNEDVSHHRTKKVECKPFGLYPEPEK